jgi:hypothetical protein
VKVESWTCLVFTHGTQTPSYPLDGILLPHTGHRRTTQAIPWASSVKEIRYRVCHSPFPFDILANSPLQVISYHSGPDLTHFHLRHKHCQYRIRLELRGPGYVWLILLLPVSTTFDFLVISISFTNDDAPRSLALPRHLHQRCQ